MARPIVLISHLFWLASMINFRKDYSPSSSSPSRPYSGVEAGRGVGREKGAEEEAGAVRRRLKTGRVTRRAISPSFSFSMVFD